MSVKYTCPECGKTGGNPKFHKGGKKICCEFCGVWTDLKDIETKILEISLGRGLHEFF